MFTLKPFQHRLLAEESTPLGVRVADMVKCWQLKGRRRRGKEGGKEAELIIPIKWADTHRGKKLRLSLGTVTGNFSVE